MSSTLTISARLAGPIFHLNSAAPPNRMRSGGSFLIAGKSLIVIVLC
jgi:hypothetical protein